MPQLRVRGDEGGEAERPERSAVEFLTDVKPHRGS
jgi:hypothetical protein